MCWIKARGVCERVGELSEIPFRRVEQKIGEGKQRFKKEWGNYNQFHNILRLLDVLPNFLFTTSETMDHYYLET